jgi:predicted esterase
MLNNYNIMKNKFFLFIFLINTLFIVSCNNEILETPIDNQNVVSEDNNPVPSEDDNVPPTITLNASSLQFDNVGNLILTANAEDASGISKINIYQGNTILFTTSSSSASTSLNLTAANNGELVFTAVAFDNANPVNSTTSNPITVLVNIEILQNDSTPPTISLNASSLQFDNAGNLILTANAEDASGISKIDIYQGNNLLNTTSSSPATTSLNITAANNGELVFTAVAFDNANPVNSTTSNPITVLVNIQTTAGNCSGSVSGSTVKRFTEIPDGNGRLREVEIETSAAYKNGENAPIVLVFHGYGGSIDASGFDFINAINDANDAGIVVTPQGIKGSGNGWDETPNGYDMPFFDNILTYIDEHYCADLSRVFVTGFSWGGDMSNALACLRGDKIRGLANFSGGDLLNQINACTTTNYPAVFFRYGTIAGNNGDNVYSLQQFEAVANFYKEALGVGNNSTNVQPNPCEQFSSGSQPLIICADPAIGHFVPTLNEEKNVWSFWMGLP